MFEIKSKTLSWSDAENFLEYEIFKNQNFLIKRFVRGNGKKIQRFSAYYHNCYVTWSIEDKLLIAIHDTDGLIPSEFEKQLSISDFSSDLQFEDAIRNMKYKEWDVLNNKDFSDYIKKESLVRNEYYQLNCFKLIKKSAKNKSKMDLGFLNTQDQDDIRSALVIEEQYSKNIWFITGLKNGVCDCFANLNNNNFAEFGSVQFSDISEAFGLSSGWDDHSFKVQIVNFKEKMGYLEIQEYCKR